MVGYRYNSCRGDNFPTTWGLLFMEGFYLLGSAHFPVRPLAQEKGRRLRGLYRRSWRRKTHRRRRCRCLRHCSLRVTIKTNIWQCAQGRWRCFTVVIGRINQPILSTKVDYSLNNSSLAKSANTGKEFMRRWFLCPKRSQAQAVGGLRFCIPDTGYPVPGMWCTIINTMTQQYKELSDRKMFFFFFPEPPCICMRYQQLCVILRWYMLKKKTTFKPLRCDRFVCIPGMHDTYHVILWWSMMVFCEDEFWGIFSSKLIFAEYSSSQNTIIDHQRITWYQVPGMYHAYLVCTYVCR